MGFHLVWNTCPRAGETRSMIVDISHLAPASLSGRATLNGKPLVKESFILWHQRPKSGGTGHRQPGYSQVGDVPVETDALGDFQMVNLVPVEYQAIHRLVIDKRKYEIKAEGKFTLVPGENTVTQLVFTKVPAPATEEVRESLPALSCHLPSSARVSRKARPPPPRS